MNIEMTKNGCEVCFNGLFSGKFTPFAEIDRKGNIIMYDLSNADLSTVYPARPASTWYGEGVLHTLRADYGDMVIILKVIEFASNTAPTGFISDIEIINDSEDDVHALKLGIECENVKTGEGKFYTSSMCGDFYTASLDEKIPEDRTRECKDWFTLYRREKRGEDGLTFAPCGAPEAYLHYQPEITEQGNLSLRIYSEMDGVLVASGKRRSSQSMFCARGAFLPLAKRVLGELAETHGSRTRFEPQFGWCSWYDKASDITEKTISDTLSVFENHRNELKLDFIQIDDGYQISLGRWGANEKFPNGLKSLARRISAIGARPGVWMAPVMASESSTMFREHPEAFARRPDGSFINSMDIRGNGDIARALDVTHPQAREFLRNILLDKLSDGFTYFKIDFNMIGVDGRRAYDPTKTSLQAYRDIYRFYREVLGENTYVLSCSGFERATFGAADGSRVGTDSSAYWSEDLCSIPSSIYQICNKTAANRLIYACDPDVTYLAPRKEIDETKRKIWHSLVGLYGGIIQISDPMENRLDKFDELRIAEPSKAPHGEALFPCTDRENRRFGFVSKNTPEACGVYVIYNRSDEEETLNTNFYPLEEIGDLFHVWSFWDGKYLGERTSDFALTIEPASCKLLRFTPIREDENPVLIGSTFHISCGVGEIEWEAIRKNSLIIKLNEVGANEGSLFVYSKKKIISVLTEGCSAELICDGDIYEIKISRKVVSDRKNSAEIISLFTE